MVWQDIVISIANVLFTISLLNQVVHGFKSKEISITLLTSGLTTFGLIGMTLAFLLPGPDSQTTRLSRCHGTERPRLQNGCPKKVGKLSNCPRKPNGNMRVGAGGGLKNTPGQMIRTAFPGIPEAAPFIRSA